MEKWKNSQMIKEWTKPYLAGQTAYVDEEWGAMVEAMEESLRLYLKLVQPPEKNPQNIMCGTLEGYHYQLLQGGGRLPTSVRQTI